MKIKFKGQEMEIPEGATFKVVGGNLVISPEDTEFEDGDILHSDWRNESINIIFKKSVDDRIYYYASKSKTLGLRFDESNWIESSIFRLATEQEKQTLFNSLRNNGKRWNPETKQIEDILKVGDICIFWDDGKCKANINTLTHIDESDFPYRSNDGYWYENAIKCTSLEQYRNFISEV